MAGKARLSRAELDGAQPLLLEQERQRRGQRPPFIDEQADEPFRLSQLQRLGQVLQAEAGLLPGGVQLQAQQECFQRNRQVTAQQRRLPAGGRPDRSPAGKPSAPAKPAAGRAGPASRSYTAAPLAG